MPATWRECPSCHDWRTDVRRDHVGAREPCNRCTSHEVGTCECCGYRPDRLKPPQEGGDDPLAAFERSWAHELERRARRR